MERDGKLLLPHMMFAARLHACRYAMRACTVSALASVSERLIGLRYRAPWETDSNMCVTTNARDRDQDPKR